jgi:hypothetical protein
MPEPEAEAVAPPTPIVVATTGRVRVKGAARPAWLIVLSAII